MSSINTLSRGPGSSERLIGSVATRRSIFIWAAAILFVNQLFGVVKEIPSASLEALLPNLLAIGTFQYLAWYAVFHLLRSGNPAPVARWRDFLVMAALCALVFIPTGLMIWVAATGIAIYLWRVGASDPRLRAAGIVLAALAVQEFWGHIFFDLVAFPLLKAEAAVVGMLMEVVRPGTVWHANTVTGPSGFGIVIATTCSSFHNLSLAMLCWLTVSRLRRLDWRPRDFAIGAAIGITMILMNVARLCLMAWSFDLYQYWHNGAGAQIFEIGASLTVLLLSLYGTRPAGRPI